LITQNNTQLFCIKNIVRQVYRVATDEMFTYTKSYAADFTYGFSAYQLKNDLVAAGVTTCQLAYQVGDTVSIQFSVDYTSQLTTINTVISNHRPYPPCFDDLKFVNVSSGPYSIINMSVKCDASGGNFTVILPKPGRVTKYVFAVHKISATGTITVSPNSGELIDGGGSKTITTYKGYVLLQSDGTNWNTVPDGVNTENTVPNAVAAITSNVGDLAIDNGSGPTALSVGSNGQVLTADSTQPLGIKWATPTASASAGGSNRQIQYNSGGSLAGDGNLQWFDVSSDKYLAIGSSPVNVQGLAMSIIKGRNSWIQVYAQNTTSAPQATTDICTANDLGDDNTYYTDMGINSSGYSDPAYPISLANDSYLYAVNGNMTVGTDTAGKDIIIHTGGWNKSNIAVRFTDKTRTAALGMMLELQSGTTESRPAAPTAGMIWYNSTTSAVEYYEGDAWQNIVNTSGAQTITNKTITDSGSNIISRGLWTGSGTRSVSTYAATAPTAGQVLTATSGTVATWQNPVTAAGGSNTQVQYNSAGAVAGASGMSIASDGYATISDETEAPPTAPTAGSKIYAKVRGGRRMPGGIGPTGGEYQFQPFIGAGKVIWWSAQGNSTTVTTLNFVNSATGTATARNVATTNLFTSSRRLGYVSSNTAGSSAGTRHSLQQFWRGTAAGLGGFYYVVRFGLSSASTVAGQRSFVGLIASTAMLGNVDPSAFPTAIVGFGVDSADTTWFFIHGDGTGRTTKDTLTGTFPPRDLSVSLFEARIYCPANGSTIYYSLEVLGGGSIYEGSTSANLPPATTLLAPQIWTNNGATALAAGIDVVSQYLETDN
jgi:hypothetical protein